MPSSLRYDLATRLGSLVCKPTLSLHKGPRSVSVFKLSSQLGKLTLGSHDFLRSASISPTNKAIDKRVICVISATGADVGTKVIRDRISNNFSFQLTALLGMGTRCSCPNVHRAPCQVTAALDPEYRGIFLFAGIKATKVLLQLEDPLGVPHN